MNGTRMSAHDPGRQVDQGTRWSLLTSTEKQTIDQLAKLGEVQQANQPLYRAFLLKEELRLLYQLDDPSLASAHLDAWLTWASRASSRSSNSPEPSAATATGSSTRSASASTTGAWKASTAASD